MWLGVYADLRILMNLREKVMVNLGQVQRRIQNWLDRFFPEYRQVFKDWEGKASLITLSEFPTPKDINSQDAFYYPQTMETGREACMKRAEQLVQAARTSIGLTEGLTAAKMELKALLEQVPGVEEMLTVPGVGFVTLAGFLAEVGDLHGYDHGQQIIRLAGFNLKENSSGEKKG